MTRMADCTCLQCFGHIVFVNLSTSGENFGRHGMQWHLCFLCNIWMLALPHVMYCTHVMCSPCITAQATYPLAHMYSTAANNACAYLDQVLCDMVCRLRQAGVSERQETSALMQIQGTALTEQQREIDALRQACCDRHEEVQVLAARVDAEHDGRVAVESELIRAREHRTHCARLVLPWIKTRNSECAEVIRESAY